MCIRDRYSTYAANIQLIRKILQSRGSSLNERSHKCFKSGDAHLYLLQDNCEMCIRDRVKGATDCDKIGKTFHDLGIPTDIKESDKPTVLSLIHI